MPYILESGTRRFIGSVGDTRPTVGTAADGTVTTDNDLPVGSSLMEIDAVNRKMTIYRWTGIAWLRADPAHPLVEYMQEILFELASIKDAIIDGLA